MYSILIIICTFLLNLNHTVYSESVINLDLNNFKFTKDLNKVSSKCRNQLTSLDKSTLLTMFDASAKLPEGILIPLFYNLGQFDECYNIDYKSKVYGKYCLGSMPITTINNLQENITQIINDTKYLMNHIVGVQKPDQRSGIDGASLYFGWCLSDGCTADDFHTLASHLDFNEENCYSKATAPELSTGAIITISVLCFFLILVVFSTVFDIYLFYTGKKNPHEFLIAFSILTNGKRLIRSSKNPNQLLCLNGLKAISMMWVVLCHVYLNAMSGPVTNLSYIKDWLDDPFNTIISEGSISVDTFLTIGGILVAYTDLRMASRSNHFDFGLYYIHRYIRLTPLLAIMILIHAQLIEYLGNGPMWNAAYNELVPDCKEYWWSALVYLQNYFHKQNSCVPQSWYLSVDFQLFILSPIVLIPLKKSEKVGLSILGCFITFGFLIPAIITYLYEINQSFLAQTQSTSQQFMFKYYKQTYTRFGPYVIGMLAGYYIYKLKKCGYKFKLSSFQVLALWCISLATLVACLVGPYDIIRNTEFQWKDVVANATVRNVWSIALCILTILCITGYGGPINWFLSLPIFQLISKLSYAIYLIHYAVIVMRYARTKQPIFMSNEYMMWTFWGDFAVTCSLSVLFYLMFESPLVIIEKYIFSCCRKTGQQKA